MQLFADHLLLQFITAGPGFVQYVQSAQQLCCRHMDQVIFVLTVKSLLIPLD